MLLFIGLGDSQAQDCSIFNHAGGDIVPNKKCAPVDVTVAARFSSAAGPDVLSDMKIRIDWGDGSAPTIFLPTVSKKADGNWLYAIENITHVYPKGGTQCNYDVVANPMVNGVVCPSQLYSGNVTVWDTDNFNGGQIALDPQYYYMCPGEEFSLKFNDISLWNCTPPLENDNINYPARWTQFIYGTNTSPGTRISGVQVDGASQPYPYRGDIKPHPDYQLAPNHTSYVVRVPATAQVGEVFEITLRNWNTCNPYDDPTKLGGPANAAEGDNAPVTNIAIIKIIDRPEGTITTRNKNNVVTESFCPGDKVSFAGSQTNANVKNVQYDWFVYNDEAGNELLDKKVNGKTWSIDEGFPTAGKKLVRMRIRNKDASNACWGEIDKIINVYAAPQVDQSLNGMPGALQEICWDNTPIPMQFGFDLFSANDYKYQLHLFKRNSTATDPDSVSTAEQNVAANFAAAATHDVNFTKAGSYRVWLTATDRITGCSTTKESEVVVRDKPKAAFSFPNLCEGLPVKFTNASTLGISVKGDVISSWEWDLDYNGTTFNADHNGDAEFEHTYAASGTYQVALKVTTAAGCSDMLVKTVQVKPVPNAALSYDYTQPICPGDPVIFSNLSSNATSRFPDGVTYTLVVRDNTTSNRYPMPDPTQTLRFTNATANIKEYEIWLEAQANAPNNCTFTSSILKVEVKPGAIAGFTAPGYDPLQPNCTPADLKLVVNQATIDIDADRYIWTVLLGTSQVKQVVQEKGTADFGTLLYTALNTTTAPLTYTVHLEAEKGSMCTVPAEEKFRISPISLADYTVTQLSQNCEETVLEVKVNNPSGIRNFHWKIFPDPDNLSTITYDDHFQLVYKRPTVTAPSYNVDLELITENYYECQSLPLAKTATIIPQELDDVKVVIVSGNDSGCSPLEVEFENQTGAAPAGTVYTVMMRHGSAPEEELVPLSGSAATRFTYKFIKEGNYQVWLKATAPDGCVRYQTVPTQVIVYPIPNADFTVDNTEGCGPLTVSFNKANITGTKRTWQVTDLTTNQLVYGPAVFDPASSDNFSFIELQNKTTATKEYRISLQTESAQGCTAASSVVVKVHPEPQASFDVLGSTNICEPYTINVKNTSSNPAGTTYTWEWGDGTSTTSTSNSLTKTYTNTSYSITLNYPVRLTAKTPNGCTAESVVQVSVAPRVLADFEADRLSGCAPLQVNFTNRSQGNTGSGSGWFIRKPGTTTFEAQGSPLSSYSFTNTGNTTVTYEVRYVATNSAGCTDEKTRTITVHPEVKQQITADVVQGCGPLLVTFSNLSPQPDVKYTWQWGDGSADGVTTTATSIQHTFENTSATTQRRYTVKVLAENTQSGCVATFSQEVVVYPLVIANVVPSVTEGCAPLQLSVRNNSLNAASHNWRIVRKDTGAEVFASTDAVPGIPPLTNTTNTNIIYEVIYKAASAESCTSEQKHQITVYPTVLADFSMDKDAGCGPFAVTFSNTNLQPGVTYTWQWGDGSADVVTTTQASVTHSFENTSATTQRLFKVRLLAENTVTGCKASITKDVVVYAQVQANVTPSVTAGCSPLQLSFQNNSQNAATHSWEVIRKNDGTLVHASSERFPALPQLTNTTNADLVYEVRYRAGSAEGCTSFQKFDITVNPAVAAAFSMDKTNGCNPLDVTFTNTSIQPGVTYTWQWGDGSADEVTTTAASISHRFENTSTSVQRRYMVRLLANNTATGCSATTSQEVVVYPQVQANVVPSVTEGCGPLQLSFQNNSQNADTHSWRIVRTDNGTEVFASTNRIPDVPLLTNATASPLVFQVTYVATSPQGCTSQQQHDITVYPGIAAAFNMDVSSAACGPTTVTFTNTNIQAGVEYSWNWGDGTAAEVTTTEAQIQHVFTNDRIDRSRFYEVTLTATNTAYGCKSVFRQTVTVNPTLLVNVQPDKQVICAPDKVVFANRSQNVSTHEWWYRLKGTTDKLEVRNSAEVEYEFTNTTDAVQEMEVVYVGTNPSGCSATAVHTITVYPSLEPAFMVDDDQPNLPNAVVTITNTTPHASAWSYQWNFGDGTTSTEVNPAPKTYNAYGTYIITLTISNGRCTATYDKEIKVGDTAPVVDFESVPIAGCAPLPVQFNNESEFTDPNSYYWDFGDGKGFSTAESPSYTYFTPGQYEVTLTARNKTGETSTMTKKMVTVYGVPKADFSIREAVVNVPGDPVYVANFSVDATTYLWDFGDGTTYTDKNPVHYYQEPGVYSITLIAANEWGCADTLHMPEAVTAEAGGKIKIPNAFTPDPGGPNGGNVEEGNNDVFFPILDGGITKYNMRIYNRWGELLFETTDRKMGWNGYYKGRLCKSDVYAYKIYVEFSDGKTLQQIGDVTLIR